MNILIFDHVGQPVRAEEEDIVREYVVLVHLDFDGRLHAERAGYVVPVRGPLGLFRGIEAAVDQFLQERMVEGDLFEFSATDAVRPRIADMRHRYLVVENAAAFA